MRCEGGSRVRDSMRRVASRPMAVVCAGYALLLLASQMTLWGGLPLAQSTGLSLSDILFWWSVPMCASAAVALMAVSLIGSCGRFALEGRFAPALSCGGHMFVMIGYCLVLFGPSGSLGMTCLASVVTGAGMGIAFAFWFDMLARVGGDSVVTLVLGSLIVSSALHLVINAFLPQALVPAFMAALVLAAACSILSMRFARDAAPVAHVQAGRSCRVRDDSAVRVLKSSMGAVRSPLYCAASIAFSVAITRMLALMSSVPSAAINDFGLARSHSARWCFFS